MGTSADAVWGLYDAFGKGDVPAVLAGFDAGIAWNEAEPADAQFARVWRLRGGKVYGSERTIREVRSFAIHDNQRLQPLL